MQQVQQRQACLVFWTSEIMIIKIQKVGIEVNVPIANGLQRRRQFLYITFAVLSFNF